MGLFDFMKKQGTKNSGALPLSFAFKDVDLCVIDSLGWDLSAVKIGAKVTFEFEPTNKFDKNAVVVKLCGNPIGYLFKGRLRNSVTKEMNSEKCEVYGIITAVSPKIQMRVEIHKDREVAITQSGDSYHFDAFCIKSEKSIMLSEAVARGLKPCKKCCKNIIF